MLTNHAEAVTLADEVQQIEIIKVPTEREHIDNLIESKAKQYNITKMIWVAKHIVQHESQYNVDAIGDMHLTCKRTGAPVEARGVVQITKCWFPEITDDQAYDVEFSIDFLMRNLADGKCKSLWTTCPL